MVLSSASDSHFPAEIAAGGVVLVLRRDQVYFEAEDRLEPDAVDQILRDHQLEPVGTRPGPIPARSLNEAFPRRRWTTIAGNRQLDQVIAALRKDGRVTAASPVYYRPDLPFPTGLSFSNRILVKLRPHASPQRLAELFRARELPNLEQNDVFDQPDGTLYRVQVPEPKALDPLDVAMKLRDAPDVKEAGPDWFELTPAISVNPNDPQFAQQWDLTQIVAPQGWDISTGVASVVVAIVDTGCDLGHEDLAPRYVPVAQRRDVVAATNTPNDDFGHGTCCAGIAAAATNNALGVAGVAWNVSIMPIKLLQNGFINSEADIVAAVDWARTNGANVVSMSWHWGGPHANADTSIAQAATANLVLCAASGNSDIGTINWPALNPNVMAIGASDSIDQRKTPASPDGEAWGSQFGAEQSVMAPGVNCWAPNNTNGGPSFNNNNGGPITIAGVNYPSSGTADGKYFSHMNGTSAATPHVAGLATLLFSAYPGLSNRQVRAIIEQTADKTGGYAYANDGIHNNGTWEQEPGYGRINVYHALDYADVYIKAFPADTGVRPFSGVFWDASDIVIRQQDDGIFSNQPAQRGQDNYIYVRVNNLGPNAARNVSVNARAVAFLGAQFVYPTDFNAIDATHLQPAAILSSFANLPSGTTAIAKFRLTAPQVETMFTGAWHSCLIANVATDNDYGSGDGPDVWQNNNLGQLNFSIRDVGAGQAADLPFVLGNRYDKSRYVELVIDAVALPADLELLLDLRPPKPVYPGIGKTKSDRFEGVLTTFLDRTRLMTTVGGQEALLTLEAGSVLALEDEDEDDEDEITLSGAEFTRIGGRRLVRLQPRVTVIGIPKSPGEMRELHLVLHVPPNAKRGEGYRLVASQRNGSGRIVGGVTFAGTILA